MERCQTTRGPARTHGLRRAVVSLLAAGLALAACGGGAEEEPAMAKAASAEANLGPAELAILVAEGDFMSESIARVYQIARGVPDANVIRVRLPVRTEEIGAADFAAVKAAVDAQLPATVQATLLTWTSPSRVTGSCTMSITSAMALGFDTKWCANTCEATAETAYFGSASRRPFTELGIRPSMMLGLGALAEAQALINRGVAADGLIANGRARATGWLVRTNDAARSVRWTDFRTLAAQAVPGVTWNYLDNSAGLASNTVANQDNLLFYFTGLPTVPQIGANRWLPGAVADHLTSTAGVLPAGAGQMPATEWLRAGATASYGTVSEPCNYPDKFPRASTLVARYQAGDTLLEAYWKSVRRPGQGLFVGEPLARPWGR